MRSSIYLQISDNYTATIYSLSDLVVYLKSEGIKLEKLVFVEEETQNQQLAEEVKEWFKSTQTINKTTKNAFVRRIKKAVELREKSSNMSFFMDTDEWYELSSWEKDDHKKSYNKAYNEASKAEESIVEYYQQKDIPTEIADDIFNTICFEVNFDPCNDFLGYFEIED